MGAHLAGPTSDIRLHHCHQCACHYRLEVGPMFVGCAVYHGPGSVCHYGVKQLNRGQVAQILKILGIEQPKGAT